MWSGRARVPLPLEREDADDDGGGGRGGSRFIDMEDSDRRSPLSEVESSPVPVPCVVEGTGLVGREDAMIGSPTKHILVFTSSSTISVMTSSGTLVACGAAELTTPIGGMYFACLRTRARICSFNFDPAKGELLKQE